MKHKKYALLEDGSIEPLFYERLIEEKNGEYYLFHDKIRANRITSFRHKIIKEADTIEELENENKEKI